MEFDKRKGKEVRIYCNQCQINTFHKILTGVDYSGCEIFDGGFDISFWLGCDIVQCGGCKDITFTKRATDSESSYPGDREVIQQLPPKEENSSWYIRNDIYELPFLLRQIYRETLQAIINKSFTLAGIGLRAIIETLCKDKSIKGRNLEKRIDDLVTKGFLTSAGADILHGIRLIGNDAAHDAKAPTIKQITAAMKVVEHLILGIYVLPEEASKALPKRQQRATKKTTKATSAKQKLGAKSGKK